MKSHVRGRPASRAVELYSEAWTRLRPRFRKAELNDTRLRPRRKRYLFVAVEVRSGAPSSFKIWHVWVMAFTKRAAWTAGFRKASRTMQKDGGGGSFLCGKLITIPKKGGGK